MNDKKLNYFSFDPKQLSELLISAQNGNSKAFDKLSVFIREISLDYFLTKQRLGKIPNREDAEDLANNVYLSFAEQYEKIQNMEFWLRRVLFLSFVNWYKKSKIHHMTEFDESLIKQEKPSEVENNIDADKIIAVIRNLSEEKQQVIRMRFWNDFKFSEIAKVLNKSEDAVKKIFYRTIEELKGKL